ncbi:MAG: hypothetical protein ACLQQB_11120 [Solirubrobacteraceae bacterium]|jgi:ATPase subunit of ABC transporter with duplicated ATPase domains
MLGVPPVIAMSGLSKDYGSGRGLFDLDLEIQRGEVFGFLGPNGAAAAVAIAGWLINGFAPLVGAIAWLKYFSLFYYYAGHDPLSRGVGIGDILILAAFSLLLTALAMAGLQRRDLRA